MIPKAATSSAISLNFRDRLVIYLLSFDFLWFIHNLVQVCVTPPLATGCFRNLACLKTDLVVTVICRGPTTFEWRGLSYNAPKHPVDGYAMASTVVVTAEHVLPVGGCRQIQRDYRDYRREKNQGF